ncbi:MAG: hypothetical protein WA980_19745 [Shinella zoogloeoides]|uniref:hypothetical protein n=1 Tax=Shinella zoogloeoides TaxID=352475 RepID=UPI003C72B5C1
MTFEALFVVMALAFTSGTALSVWLWFQPVPRRLRLFALIWAFAGGAGMLLSYGKSGIIPDRNALRVCIESGQTWDYRSNRCLP